MTICMSDILCITNRALCREDFLLRIEQIAAAAPDGIVLREKDLTQQAYTRLAAQVMEICAEHHVPCILHSFIDAAIALDAAHIHLPLPILRRMTQAQKAQFSVIGASCHSIDDAKEAERLGCGYITAGHIFATDCKQGLPGRGPEFLRQVCASISIPVYATGGIGAENIDAVRACGAKGACVMSSVMTCDDIPGLLNALKE